MKKSLVFLLVLMGLTTARFDALAQRTRPATTPVTQASRPDTSRTKPRLVVVARNYGDSVVLRWAPGLAAHFLRGSQTGYWVQRIELSSQNPKGSRTRLSTNPVRPWTVDEARQRIRPDNKADQFVAMGLQMLYGKGYTKTFTPDAASIINLSQEQDNRFSVAMLAADFSAKAANALGLRWVDRSPRKRDAIYLYQIFSANPKPGPNDLRDTAAVAVAPPDVFRPAAPLIEEVQNGDGVITLVWNRRSTQGSYSGFYVERSLDGQHFRRMTDTPYIQSKPDEATQKRDTVRFRPSRHGQQLMTYTDSVKANYRRFFYRIIGVDAFGDLSPASPVVTGMAHDLTPPLPPQNLRTQVVDNRQVRVIWNQNPLNKLDGAGYVVGRSRNVNGPFQPLTTTPLPSTTLDFTDTKPNSYGNYYTVGVIDTAGNVAFAPAVIAVIADMLPPKVPTGLTAETDTNGVVRLTWPLGQDDDIVSYKVYRSYERENDFYRQLTPLPIEATTYQDTLPRPILNEVVYYKLVAIDRTGNHSTLSAPLEVKVPDRIPPTAPVAKGVVVDAKGVLITALPSSSVDVVEHRLYRRKGDEEWRLIRRVTGQITNGLTLRDTVRTGGPTTGSLQSGNTYTYALTAIDKSQLESPKSFPIPVQFTTNVVAAPVRKLQASYNQNRGAITLQWEFVPTTIPYHFVVYRSVNGEGLTMYKAVDGQQRSFQDIELASSGRYAYALRVQYHERGPSQLSETAQVTK